MKIQFQALSVLLCAAAAAVFFCLLFIGLACRKKFRNTMFSDPFLDCLTEHGFLDHASARMRNRADQFACISMTLAQMRSVMRSYEPEQYLSFMRDILSALKNMLGTDSCIMRCGDDTFVFLMQNRSPNEISAKLDQLCTTINTGLSSAPDEPSVHLKPVFGIYLPEQPGEETDRIVRLAHAAAACAGPNRRYHFYSRETGEKNARDYAFACSIPRAIRSGELLVYFQPDVRLSDQKIIGAEALVRWRKPQHGILTPDMFLPAAERFGMIEHIDRYVFEEICRTLARWKKQGRELCPVSVNLSAASADCSFLADDFAEICRSFDVSPSLIMFECKEHVILDNPDVIRSLFECLHSHGFRCAVDNFGASMSSLQLLGNYSLDTVKLDRSFFYGANNNRSGRNLLENVLRLAAQMHIHTVAEGVDQAAQVQYLRQAACDAVQGFYFFQPMGLENFENAVYDGAVLGYATVDSSLQAKSEPFEKASAGTERTIILFNYHIDEDTVAFSDAFSPVLDGGRVFDNALALFRTTALVHEKDREDFLRLLDRCRHEKGWVESTLRFCLPPDRYEWLEVRIHCDGTLITGMLADMSGWKNEINRWKEKAARDPLTGLYNRAQFEQNAAALLNQKKHDCAALIFLDVDDFKRVNDTWGHMFGDDVLCFVAKQLLGVFRHTDLIARYAGDEFVVFAPSLSREVLCTRLEKLLATFQYPYRNDGVEYNLSVTIGASLYPNDGMDYETLLDHADCALYEAKNRGKKRYVLYEPSMQGEKTKSKESV